MSTEHTSFPSGEKLILGFDAGCMACSDIAGRIEAVVGDKLEVRSLHDPQVAYWRRQSLGEDAPWAPILIEVKDGKVKAWPGMRMGARLSLSLGITGTWKLLRALGETKAAGGVEESSANGSTAGVTRAQLLKGGLAGAVVGVGALSGTNLLASRADAVENNPGTALANQPISVGTPEEQDRAKSIVRSSGAYERLATEQSRALGNLGASEEAPLDLDQATVFVYGQYASVLASSLNPKRNIIATFIVDLSRETLGNVRTVEITPISGGQEAQVVFQENFRDLKKFSRVVLGQDYMVENGRRMSYDEGFDEIKKVKAERASDAEYQLQSFCSNAINLLAGPAVSAASCGIACSIAGLATLSIGGLACAAVCSIILAVGADQAALCVCENQGTFCP